MELEFNSPFDILYQNEPNGEFSYIGILNNVFNDDYLDFLYNWLEKSDDFKTGHTSFGAIPRLQKWYQRDKHYFSYKWKDQNLDRWKSNDYDSVLDDLETLGFFLRSIGDIARNLNLKDGYRVICNTGFFGGQEIPHLHFHILSGRPLGRLVS